MLSNQTCSNLLFVTTQTGLIAMRVPLIYHKTNLASSQRELRIGFGSYTFTILRLFKKFCFIHFQLLYIYLLLLHEVSNYALVLTLNHLSTLSWKPQESQTNGNANTRNKYNNTSKKRYSIMEI